MDCEVDGRGVAPGCVVRRPMNFRQSWPEPAVPVVYSLSIAKDEFIRSFGPIYRQRAAEETGDIPFHSAGEVLVLDRWQELNYPPLNDLYLREPGFLGELLRWFDLDVLDCFLPGQAGERASFIVNSLDRAIVGEHEVRLEGIAYEDSLRATMRSLTTSKAWAEEEKKLLEATESLDRGEAEDMTAEDWQDLRRRARQGTDT
jgi:hypothetical protein